MRRSTSDVPVSRQATSRLPSGLTSMSITGPTGGARTVRPVATARTSTPRTVAIATSRGLVAQRAVSTGTPSTANARSIRPVRASQTEAVGPVRASTRRPSELQRGFLTGPVAAWSVRSGAPSAAFHVRTSPLLAVETMVRPSGLKRAPMIGRSAAARSATSRCAATSQTRMCPSA